MGVMNFEFTYGWKAIGKYNNKYRLSQSLSRDDEDWDELYCSMRIEHLNARNKWTNFMSTIRSFGENASTELMRGKFRKWEKFSHTLDCLEYAMYHMVQTKDNLKDWEDLYLQLRELNRITLADLFDGEKYTVNNAGSEDVYTFSFK